MIPPSIKEYNDVHGLGREYSDELPGLLHGVIDRENASTFYDINLRPSGTSCSELISTEKILSCENINGDTILYKCFIQTFLINLNYSTTVLKYKRVTLEDIKVASY